MRPSLGRAIAAGFVATLVLTGIMYYVAPLMLPGPMDVAQMLAGVLGTSWMVGMVVHFILGTLVFPLIYVYALYPVLPGAPWVKGLVWGAILWVAAELLLVPMAGGGVFHSASPAGVMGVMGSLIGHLVYGAVLGAIAGGPVTAAPPRREAPV